MPFQVDDKVRYIGSLESILGAVGTVRTVAERSTGVTYCHVDLGTDGQWWVESAELVALVPADKVPYCVPPGYFTNDPIDHEMTNRMYPHNS